MNLVLQHSQIPTTWSDARVALLPKPDGSTPPLSVASVLWRIGARVLVRKLSPWIRSWTDASVVGGLPGTSANSVHSILSHAISKHYFCLPRFGAVFRFCHLGSHARNFDLVVMSRPSHPALIIVRAADFSHSQVVFRTIGFLRVDHFCQDAPCHPCWLHVSCRFGHTMMSKHQVCPWSCLSMTAHFGRRFGVPLRPSPMPRV